VGQRDHLGVFVAGGAIMGVLGLSFIIGPELVGDDVAQVIEVPTVTPSAPPAAPPAAPGPQPEAPAAPGAVVHAIPLQVRIGAITVDAPIVAVGLEPDGAMEIPDRVAEIGWYDPDGLGVRPGATGTAVFAGHVDSRTQGRGALYDLRDLRVGEIIEVDLDDGSMQRWLITDVIQYPKDVLPSTSCSPGRVRHGSP
jgi:hypothetical protein